MRLVHGWTPWIRDGKGANETSPLGWTKGKDSHCGELGWRKLNAPNEEPIVKFQFGTSEQEQKRK